jgi:hypothetical protein
MRTAKSDQVTDAMPAAFQKEPLPIVTCPGCNKPMVPGKPEPSSASGLADIVYRCESCGTTTTRTVKQASAPERRGGSR